MGLKQLSLFLLAIGTIVATSVAITQSRSGSLPIPTLDLQGTRASGGLFGAVVSDVNGIRLTRSTASEAAAGIVLNADEHNIFVCSEAGSLLSAGMQSDTVTRFWAYEYSGNEIANMRAGRIGRELFDGEFFISQGELNASPGQFDYLNTLTGIEAGKTYYFMLERDLGFQCDQGVLAIAQCGDGVDEGSEQCDDGNQVGGDGCENDCTISTSHTQNPLDTDRLLTQYAVYRVVEANGGTLSNPPSSPTFDDVPSTAWYYGHFEEAATESWYRGLSSDCAGTHPCVAGPATDILRGKLADLFVRAFSLQPTGAAPQFTDTTGNPYAVALQTAADHCIFLPVSNGTVVPDGTMLVGEFERLLSIINEGMTYGTDCDQNGILRSVQTAVLEDAQNVTPTGSPATGVGSFWFDDFGRFAYEFQFNNLTSPATMVHIHGPAARGVDADVFIAFDEDELAQGVTHTGVLSDLDPLRRAEFRNGLWYINVHTQNYPAGEIRGQLDNLGSASSSSSSATSESSSESSASSETSSSSDGGSSSSLSDTSSSQSALACVRCSDVNRNGVVTTADSGLVGSHIGECAADPGYSLIYDLNEDGCITEADRQCVLDDMGATGVICTEDGSSSSSESSLSSDQSSSSSAVAAATIDIVHERGTTAWFFPGVQNQTGFLVTRFTATASNAAADITELSIDQNWSASPVGTMADMTNYSLWYDGDGNGTVETQLVSGVVAGPSAVTFSNLAAVMPDLPVGTARTFEVHADVSTSLQNDLAVVQAKFATGSVFLRAQEVASGLPLTGLQYAVGAAQPTAIGCTANVDCAIRATLTLSVPILIFKNGNLLISAGPGVPFSQQLLGGSGGSLLIPLRFATDYEPIDVRFVVLQDIGPNAARFSSNVDQLEFYEGSSTTPVMVARAADCSGIAGLANPSRMCIDLRSNPLRIALNTPRDFAVRPRMKTDNQGATRGDAIRVSVDSASQATLARGAISLEDLPPNDGSSQTLGEVLIGSVNFGPDSQIASPVSDVVHAKLASVYNGDPNPNGTAITNGTDRTIGRFTFTARPHGNTLNGLNDWTLSGVIFNVSATNMRLGTTADQSSPATSDFRLYNSTNASVKSVCTASAVQATGNFTVRCPNIAASPVATQVDPGTSQTFVLEVDVLNEQINVGSSATVQVLLQNFSTRQTSPSFGTSAGQSHIAWVDDDAGTDVQFFWIDNYPLSSVVTSTCYGTTGAAPCVPQTNPPGGVPPVSSSSASSAFSSSSSLQQAANCGNAVPESGEECDDGNANNNDACIIDVANSYECRTAVCGDGYEWNTGGGTEECDDGNLIDGDGCFSNCTLMIPPDA